MIIIPPGLPNLATELRRRGYATWHVEKWHLGGPEYHPDRVGFDSNVGGSEYGRPIDGYFSPWHLPSLQDQAPGTYLTDYQTVQVIDLIQRRDTERPFSLNLCCYAVHTPIEAKEQHVQKYRES